MSGFRYRIAGRGGRSECASGFDVYNPARFLYAFTVERPFASALDL